MNESGSAGPFAGEAFILVNDPLRSSSPPGNVLENGLNCNSDTSENTIPDAQRSQTMSTASLPMQVLSIYAGATRPSHPYAMYQQVVISRPPSVTTTSTARQVDRPLSGTEELQDPYSVSPQGIAIRGTEHDYMIPPRFAGDNLRDQRPSSRLDNDVGDIVGPAGYIEQLPPYSPYPNGVAPKPVGGFGAVATTSSIWNANRNNNNIRAQGASEQSLAEELPIRNERQGLRNDEHPIGVMISKVEPKGRWKQRLCCGLPIWAFALVGVVLLISASIGGVMGFFQERGRHP